MPLVFRLTDLIGRSWARSMKSRICLWMVGSPPENITTSASPSQATNTSSIRAHCSRVIEYPSGWWPESAKQIGQSRLQPVLTSMIPRQACCLCSGHSPQSLGQPSFTSVWRSAGSCPAC